VEDVEHSIMRCWMRISIYGAYLFMATVLLFIEHSAQ